MRSLTLCRRFFPSKTPFISFCALKDSSFSFTSTRCTSFRFSSSAEAPAQPQEKEPDVKASPPQPETACPVAPHPLSKASLAIPEISKDALAEQLSQLTLKELSEVQRLVFKKLGHSDDFYEKALLSSLGGGGGGGGGRAQAAPVAAGGAGPGDAAPAAAAAPPAKPEKKKVEKLTADVKLAAYAPEIKIKLIKELRTVTSMSIADAKKAVEKCPGLVATNLAKADAEKLKTAFEKLGAKAEIL